MYSWCKINEETAKHAVECADLLHTFESGGGCLCDVALLRDCGMVEIVCTYLAVCVFVCCRLCASVRVCVCMCVCVVSVCLCVAVCLYVCVCVLVCGCLAEFACLWTLAFWQQLTSSH